MEISFPIQFDRGRNKDHHSNGMRKKANCCSWDSISRQTVPISMDRHSVGSMMNKWWLWNRYKTGVALRCCRSRPFVGRLTWPFWNWRYDWQTEAKQNLRYFFSFCFCKTFAVGRLFLFERLPWTDDLGASPVPWKRAKGDKAAWNFNFQFIAFMAVVAVCLTNQVLKPPPKRSSQEMRVEWTNASFRKLKAIYLSIMMERINCVIVVVTIGRHHN